MSDVFRDAQFHLQNQCPINAEFEGFNPQERDHWCLFDPRDRPKSSRARDGTANGKTKDDARALHQRTADHLHDQDGGEDREAYTDKLGIAPDQWLGGIGIRTESVNACTVETARTASPLESQEKKRMSATGSLVFSNQLE